MDTDDYDDKVSRNPELFSAEPIRSRRTFSYQWSAGYLSPHVTTNAGTIAAIAEKVVFKPGDVVADLGCGSGALLLGLLACPPCQDLHGVGIDLDTALLAQAQDAAAAQGMQHRTMFMVQDILEVDLMQYTVVLLFQLPAALAKLGPKLQSFLKSRPGATVISVVWPVEVCSPLLLRSDMPAADSPCGSQHQGFHVYSSAAWRVVDQHSGSAGMVDEAQ